MWKNEDCPCTKDCPDRWVSVDDSTPRTCHGTCERYAKWVKKRAADKKAHAVRRERYMPSQARKKALYLYYRRDSHCATKKFSQ